jgi:hypothetical protein
VGDSELEGWGVPVGVPVGVTETDGDSVGGAVFVVEQPPNPNGNEIRMMLKSTPTIRDFT